MEEMEKEKHSDDALNQSAECWLEELFRNYAWMAAVAVASMAQSGWVELRGLRLANETVRTLVMISDLIEKERERSNR